MMIPDFSVPLAAHRVEHRPVLQIADVGLPLVVLPQQPAETWTTADLAFEISSAVFDCNDVDGVDWLTVARRIADALDVKLVEAR